MAHRVRTPENPVFRLQNFLLLDPDAAWLPRRCRRGGPLVAAAGTNIVVTENVRYWHAVAGAMSHNKQTLQSADAGSNPGWCILTTVATKLAASRLQ
jgi:hypothetical protein